MGHERRVPRPCERRVEGSYPQLTFDHYASHGLPSPSSTTVASATTAHPRSHPASFLLKLPPLPPESYP